MSDPVSTPVLDGEPPELDERLETAGLLIDSFAHSAVADQLLDSARSKMDGFVGDSEAESEAEAAARQLVDLAVQSIRRAQTIAEAGGIDIQNGFFGELIDSMTKPGQLALPASSGNGSNEATQPDSGSEPKAERKSSKEPSLFGSALEQGFLQFDDSSVEPAGASDEVKLVDEYTVEVGGKQVVLYEWDVFALNVLRLERAQPIARRVFVEDYGFRADETPIVSDGAVTQALRNAILRLEDKIGTRLPGGSFIVREARKYQLADSVAIVDERAKKNFA